MENIFEGVIGFIVVILFIIILWVVPIWLGLKWAKIKGVSKLWMLFGIHPFFGWIAFLILRYGVEPRKQCYKCKESIKMEAQICRYCGNQMSQEEINYAMKEYQDRKK
ncbi:MULTISPECIES: hypothetical protein [Flavobacteriaceae]|jgi:hypothetical protein|uniref:Uncharacterized protein n=1 Tax=Pseudotamlana carrageenivorans TaxID=2069432 RepID=A0A2I7SLV3_9FLAO|nr:MULTISPECIES: hypothetical protein [Flavobacteriaceae]AUS06847.1 hypothetical protein C1A40_15975 [Tamlana carrageenivorans]PKG42585.1 hypothetical protein CXF67_09495 [Psychroflexus sp. MES1-P1E]|tara:strand:+ start:127 stop:450 length:324 start_codon:yes stop_codon:yes gene_type:complete